MTNIGCNQAAIAEAGDNNIRKETDSSAVQHVAAGAKPNSSAVLSGSQAPSNLSAGSSGVEENKSGTFAAISVDDAAEEKSVLVEQPGPVVDLANPAL